jgi:hypothetical protein
MEKTTHIVLIAITPSTSYTTDVRKICNEIEGIEIQVPNHIVKVGEFVHTHILTEHPTLAYDDVQVYGLGDFMALNNDEEYHADDWFMSYVFTK